MARNLLQRIELGIQLELGAANLACLMPAAACVLLLGDLLDDLGGPRR